MLYDYKTVSTKAAIAKVNIDLLIEVKITNFPYYRPNYSRNTFLRAIDRLKSAVHRFRYQMHIDSLKEDQSFINNFNRELIRWRRANPHRRWIDLDKKKYQTIVEYAALKNINR